MQDCYNCCCYMCAKCMRAEEVGTICSNYIDKDYILKNLHVCIRDRRNIDWLIELVKSAAEVPWMNMDIQKALSNIYGTASFTTVKNGKIKSEKGNTWIGVS